MAAAGELAAGAPLVLGVSWVLLLQVVGLSVGLGLVGRGSWCGSRRNGLGS